MRLREFFQPGGIALPLAATAPEQVIPELLGLLHLDERSSSALLRVLQRREEMETTGVGRGIAIPHGRSLAVNRVLVAYGHSPAGIPWRALDEQPVHHFFLIVAPPIEVTNQYLPVLGKIAAFAKEPDVPERLARLEDADAFLRLLDEKGV
jgi:mannitol/fructose-specific phosphotransferase system IIA component (Ntr-type)